MVEQKDMHREGKTESILCYTLSVNGFAIAVYNMVTDRVDRTRRKCRVSRSSVSDRVTCS